MPTSFPEPPASESPTQASGESGSRPSVNASVKALSEAPVESLDGADDGIAITQAKTVVQSALAIAAGYLFIALGVIALMGFLESQAPIEFTFTLLLILGLIQLVLATAGGYITALIAPRRPDSTTDNSQTVPLYQQQPFKHGIGLMVIALILWVVSAIVGHSQEPLPIQFLNLITAILGIGTGAWLRLRHLNASQLEVDP